MPEPGQFHSPEHFYSVCAHEITYSSGNGKRLDCNLSGKIGSKPCAFEELIAVLGSAFVMAAAVENIRALKIANRQEFLIEIRHKQKHWLFFRSLFLSRPLFEQCHTICF